MQRPDHRESVDQENPFRPGGELSQEADQIVSLIKQGKPITPVASPVQDEEPEVTADQPVDEVDVAPQRPARMIKKEEKERKKAIKETKKILSSGIGIGNKVCDQSDSGKKSKDNKCKSNGIKKDVVEVKQILMEQKPEFAESVTLPADETDRKSKCCGRSGCTKGCCKCTLL